MKRRILNLIFGGALTVAALAIGHVDIEAQNDGACDEACRKAIAAARAGTADYHDFDAALADGFVRTSACVGGMGFHYTKAARVDQNLDPAEPEVLLYMPNEEGRLQLVAVEYVVPNTGSNPVPELFGQPFYYNPARNRYELHAWIWRHNPDGIFANYNPRMICPVG